MRLERQVVSLELAKHLKELGVKQESYFFWNRADQDLYRAEARESLKSVWNETAWLSAFTVAELGEMLPRGISSEKGDQFFFCCFTNATWKEWWQEKFGEMNERDLYMITSADSEADARAKMLIYLLERGLVTVPRLHGD